MEPGRQTTRDPKNEEVISFLQIEAAANQPKDPCSRAPLNGARLPWTTKLRPRNTIWIFLSALDGFSKSRPRTMSPWATLDGVSSHFSPHLTAEARERRATTSLRLLAVLNGL